MSATLFEPQPDPPAGLTVGDELVAFDVLGDPAPQGSKTRMPNGAVIEGASATMRRKHAAWRAALADSARHQRDELDAALDGPLGLQLGFRTTMPASRRAPDRRRGVAWRTSAPDLDKLVRTVCDGLTAGGLIRDDARFASLVATKIEVVDGWTGATISIRRLA